MITIDFLETLIPEGESLDTSDLIEHFLDSGYSIGEAENMADEAFWAVFFDSQTPLETVRNHPCGTKTIFHPEQD